MDTAYLDLDLTPAHGHIFDGRVTASAADRWRLRSADAAAGSRRTNRGWLAAFALLACVCAANVVETAIEQRLSPTVTSRGLEFASALHWLEGATSFTNHDVSNVVSVYGFSVVYFVVFPLLIVCTGWALARKPRSRAFLTYSVALTIDYAISLPFFLLFPVPERWAYPDSGAVLLSDLWDSRLIELIRPMSALDNCFPSFHSSMTVVIVLCCFVYRVGFRSTVLPLGAMVLLSTYALGVHWLGDVVAGAALGVISTAVACRLTAKYRPSGPRSRDTDPACASPSSQTSMPI
jgi:membrane-associated phospholipid phosphatase